MILFDLKCENDHKFEAWFPSSSNYEDQLKKKMIECPYCNSKIIKKSLMAPNLNLKSRSKKNSTDKKKDLSQINIENKIKKFKIFIEKNTENVGKNFAEEARKIYYGEEKARPIRGESTEKESQELAEEGISFSKLPWYSKEDA
tara:strand:- start:2012 stop:2443 length:432 start_codon:yes stop_codon:yes gene_type:complete